MRKEPPVKSAFFTIEGNQITISESLKLDNTAVFLKDIEFFFRANPNTELSVNLTFLKQIDSAGAVAIHSLMKRANKYNITLNIKDPQPTIKNKLNLFKPVEKKTTTGSY
ncbi:MAG: STAS domain-containing protein, partial [Bacteroidota bacterium]